jgi:hypothetical protein
MYRTVINWRNKKLWQLAGRMPNSQATAEIEAVFTTKDW